jgi:hypothetical protein
MLVTASWYESRALRIAFVRSSNFSRRVFFCVLVSLGRMRFSWMRLSFEDFLGAIGYNSSFCVRGGELFFCLADVYDGGILF